VSLRNSSLIDAGLLSTQRSVSAKYPLPLGEGEGEGPDGVKYALTSNLSQRERKYIPLNAFRIV
jgi:hypothetical protein